MGRPILSPFYIGGIEQIIASDKHIQTNFSRGKGTIFPFRAPRNGSAYQMISWDAV